MATNLKFRKIATVPSEGLEVGTIYFETSTGIIKVATSATASQAFSGVQDVTVDENVVTFKRSVGDPVVLDLSDCASADSVTAELAKKLNIGTSADASSVVSYYGLKKYVDEQIDEIPAAVVYEGDGTTITQSGSNTVTFSVGAIEQSKVTGLEAALAGKATSVQGAKADTALQTITATGDTYITASASPKSDTTQAITVQANVSTAVDTSDKLITSNAVKTYVDTQITSKISSTYVYKGSCTYGELPEDAEVGDVWNVTDQHENVPAGTNYAWDGEAWDALGGTVDLSAYLTSETAASTYATKTELTSGLDGKVSTTRTINGKALSADIVLAGGDILVGGDGTYAEEDITAALEDIDTRLGNTATASNVVTSINGSKGAITIASGSTNGTIAVAGSDIAVKGLGTAAYTASTDYATAAQGALADTALQKADITTGTTNGTINVDGTAVAVHGLGSAAYTESTAYDAAGAASSALADAKEYADSLHVWAVFE